MDLSPPPPPSLPPPSSTSSLFRSFPVIAIAIIGILATAFLLVAYYIFVIKCCLHWQRHRRNRDSDAGQNLSSSDSGDLQKNGLDEAVIRSIPVIKFRKLAEQERENEMTKKNKKSEKLETYECAVCLSEFEDGEKLRVIPNCCHAFHIDCIDIWLQSCANCPLCRSGISPSSILSLSNNDRILSYPLPQPQQSSDDFSGSDEDYVVIEIQGNNLDQPRLVGVHEKKGLSMGDECLDMREKKDGEFGDVQPIRRSISMDLSSHREFCLEIQGISSQQCGEIGSESERPQVCHFSSSRVRKSIFSFGYGRSSRCSVQPLPLDP